MEKNVTKIARFVDNETKKTVKHVYVTPVLDGARKYRCMWCTLNVENEPIGCPIDVIEKLVNNKNLDQMRSVNFQTFGVFCCFNCAKAYCCDRSFDPKFKHSPKLLASMYRLLHDSSDPITITPSPHPAMMSAYGGDMSEAQYRQCVNRAVYVNKGILKLFPVTVVYEESEIAY